MPTWPNQDKDALNKFYGNPDGNGDLRCDVSWETKNIVRIKPPFTMFYPEEIIKTDSLGRKKKVLILRPKILTAIAIHIRCADSLTRCLSEIPKQFSPQEIEKYQLDIYGGGFNFRLMRNGRSLSMHSWGCAIDISHLINWYGRKYDASKDMMPAKVIQIFKNEGWTWGGKWSTADGMHFQAANI